MVEPDLEKLFPGLAGKSFAIKSPKDDHYNCIAWAAGDIHNWWWPDSAHQDTWPAGVPRLETMSAFRDAFASLGYTVCDSEELETGHEKIALLALAGVPKHAARRLSSGRWTSKLGFLEDIEHDLHDLEGTQYGSVIIIMKRAQPALAGD